MKILLFSFFIPPQQFQSMKISGYSTGSYNINSLIVVVPLTEDHIMSKDTSFFRRQLSPPKTEFVSLSKRTRDKMRTIKTKTIGPSPRSDNSESKIINILINNVIQLQKRNANVPCLAIKVFATKRRFGITYSLNLSPIIKIDIL